jgi:hypothetical protein
MILLQNKTMEYDEKLLRSMTNYKEDYDELQKINQDIKNYRMKFEKRIKELKQSMDKKGEFIVDYMKKHNHPGIRYNNLNFVTETKTHRISKKKQEEQLDLLLSKYQISKVNPLYHELKRTLSGSPDNSTNMRLKIKK